MHEIHSAVRPLERDLLDIANKTRSNLFAWRGQFSPQLVDALITNYAPPGATILDPFAGSGAVLCEAARLGFPAVGTEINPAAISLARLYELANMPLNERRALLEDLHQSLKDTLSPALPLFERSDHNYQRPRLPEAILALLNRTDRRESRHVLEALLILLDVGRYKPNSARLRQKWNTLRESIEGLPYCELPIRTLLADCRVLPLHESAVGFVVTSPPYINVFNYHQQYRRSAEILGCDLLAVARSEIGSNRKHRGNRFLTVVQYCLDMARALGELRRVCRTGAQMILVVGRESNVRKTPFFNADIIETLATDCVGLSCPLRQERVFTNRFGQRIFEDVLHFINVGGSSRELVSPRRVAYYALKSALARAPRESVADLRTAMESVDEVKESPLLRPDGVAQEPACHAKGRW